MARWRYWRLKEVRFLGIPASTSEMDFGMTMGFPSISAVRQMKGVYTGNCRAEALCYPVGKLLCRVATREEGMTAEELHESLWHDFFAHPSKWWDHRRRKLTTRSPDFRHKISKVPLWLNSRHRPAWVDSQLAALDARMTTPPQSVSSSIEGQGGIERLGGHDGPLDIGMCRKLCEDGRISEAVDTLKILVQQGCHGTRFWPPTSSACMLHMGCWKKQCKSLERYVHQPPITGPLSSLHMLDVETQQRQYACID